MNSLAIRGSQVIDSHEVPMHRAAIAVLIACSWCAASAAAADPAPTEAPPASSALQAGYWAVDAVLSLPVQSKRSDEIAPIRRYVLKDPRTATVGGRQFLVGDGVRDWQAGGLVMVPVDAIVAMARFANVQVHARYDGKDVEIGSGLK